MNCILFSWTLTCLLALAAANPIPGPESAAPANYSPNLNESASGSINFNTTDANSTDHPTKRFFGIVTGTIIISVVAIVATAVAAFMVYEYWPQLKQGSHYLYCHLYPWAKCPEGAAIEIASGKSYSDDLTLGKGVDENFQLMKADSAVVDVEPIKPGLNPDGAPIVPDPGSVAPAMPTAPEGILCTKSTRLCLAPAANAAMTSAGNPNTNPPVMAPADVNPVVPVVNSVMPVMNAEMPLWPPVATIVNPVVPIAPFVNPLASFAIVTAPEESLCTKPAGPCMRPVETPTIQAEYPINPSGRPENGLNDLRLGDGTSINIAIAQPIQELVENK